MVIWLMGLSGARKTTIGRELFEQWRQLEPSTVLLDGDRVRAVVGAAGNAGAADHDGGRPDRIETYRSTPLSVCAVRDRKNLYLPALAGKRQTVVGIDIPFFGATGSGSGRGQQSART
jgi:adenylylsulfate kinase-like enzyme